MRLLFLDLTDTGTQLLIILLAVGVVGWWKGRRLATDWRHFRQWQAAGKPLVVAGGQIVQQNTSAAPPMIETEDRAEAIEVVRTYPLDGIQPPFTVDLSVLPSAKLDRAGDAMARPPTSLWYSLEYIRQNAPKGRFTFPIGWWINPNMQARLAVGHLIEDAYCGLITAIQGGGKDNALLNMLLTLMLLNSPEEVQIVIIDGKGGLDYNGWEQKAHVWHVARHGHDLPKAMDLLTAERMRRVNLIYEEGKSKWESLKGPRKPPLMVVIFSEIKVLQQAMKRSEIETYLDTELSVWRALGMRMFVCTQNSSNWSKEWRAAFEFFMAGTQPSRDEDKPNTGKDQSALRAMGLVPPSELPDVGTAPGALTVVHGNHGRNVRTSFIDDDQRAYWLAHLPEATGAQLQAREQHKQELQESLRVFRAAVEHPDQVRKFTLPNVSQQPGVYEAIGAGASIPAQEQPIIAQGQPTMNGDYDRQALERLLVTISQDRSRRLEELADESIFVAACVAEYSKVKTNAGVVRALWGADGYSGTKDRVVKAALERAAQAQRGLQDDTFLQGLLAA